MLGKARGVRAREEDALRALQGRGAERLGFVVIVGQPIDSVGMVMLVGIGDWISNANSEAVDQATRRMIPASTVTRLEDARIADAEGSHFPAIRL